MHTAIIINNQFKYTSGFYRQSHQTTSSDQTHYWSLISNLSFSLAPWVLAAGQIKTLTLTGFMDQIYTSINNDNHNSFFFSSDSQQNCFSTAVLRQDCLYCVRTAVLHQNCLYCVRTAVLHKLLGLTLLDLQFLLLCLKLLIGGEFNHGMRDTCLFWLFNHQ